MTREEAFEVLNFEVEEAKMVCLEDYYDGSEQEQAAAFIRAVDRLKQPLTLAEFLGWEEGQEYRRGGNILKVEGNHLLNELPDGHFHNTNCTAAELIDLRNATKHKPLYYAKIKGWELIPSDYYYFGLDDNHNLEIKDACDAYEFTKTEWAELGINDSNADFQEVEE